MCAFSSLFRGAKGDVVLEDKAKLIYNGLEYLAVVD
jgi:hypothetical protein